MEQACSSGSDDAPLAGVSFPEFLRAHVWHQIDGGTQIAPWPWQIELAEALPHMKRAQFLKARQIGMSWLMGAYALHTALSRAGAEVLITSQTQPDAVALLDKIRFMHERLPAGLQGRTGRDNTQHLEFSAITSHIRALPSTERAGRGFTGRLAIADEHAFHQWAEANMSSIDPAIEADGQFLSLSSANGMGNFFHTLWAAGVQHRPPVLPRPGPDGPTFGDLLMQAVEETRPEQWLPVFLPYSARPGRDEEWWERKRLVSIPSWLIFQEYPRDPDEAFVQTGRPVFAREILDPHRALCLRPMAKPEWESKLAPELERVAEMVKEPALCRLAADELRIWELPVAKHRYVAGADVAEGLEHGDYSDLVIFDADASPRPREVLSLHGHWAPDIFGRIIAGLTRLYPGIAGIERNNHGLTTVIAARDAGASGLYAESPVLGKTGEIVREGRIGWLTTPITKPLMIDHLGQALREMDMELRDELALPELASYQIKPDGSTGAPAGQWDDRVMSRAIAAQMLQRLPGRVEIDGPEFDEGCGTLAPRRW